jgi:hypothetical protein
VLASNTGIFIPKFMSEASHAHEMDEAFFLPEKTRIKKEERRPEAAAL